MNGVSIPLRMDYVLCFMLLFVYSFKKFYGFMVQVNAS